MITKILFVDCDGVVNSHETFERRSADLKERQAAGELTPHEVDRYIYMCDDDKVNALIDLCRRTGARIVISSVWRMNMRRCREVFPADVLHPTDDATKWRVGDSPNELRGEQLEEWLQRHPEVTKWAGVDDDRDFLPHQHEHMVYTNTALGLTSDNLAALSTLLEDTA